MPGHKGSYKHYEELKNISDNLYSLDVTEVNGTDNLHNPEEAIKLSQEETAKLYNSGESFYLVNGSTSGVYSMVLSCVNKGDKIIVQRNSHRSVFMAAYLGELEVEYINPKILDEFSIAASVSIEDVKNVIEENKDAKAVVLTSPTYYGTCSDIEAISSLTRKYGMLLLVDSAHGAHFPFNNKLPKNPISLGADMEVVSFHKTLPSLTQTGVLNVSSDALNKINIEKLKFMLRLYQSTSPSYIFLASIEAAASIMARDGEVLLDSLIRWINDFKYKLKDSEFYSILDNSYIGKSSIKHIDSTRLVISSKLGGVALSDILRNEYSIQVEMADDVNIVIIGSVFDCKEDYTSLYKALTSIEKRFSNVENSKKSCILDYSYDAHFTIFKGYSLPKVKVPLEESLGKISGEIIAPYPPGIPILLPGEVITYDKIKCINTCRDLNIEVNGIEDNSLITVKVIDSRFI